MESEYETQLEDLLTRLGLQFDSSDIENISCNLSLISGGQLQPMINRFFKSNKAQELRTTLFEIYFTAEIINNHQDSSISYQYEPITSQKRPDLKIIFEGVTYTIQIKSAQSLQRDNRTMKLFKKIKKEAGKIPIHKFFSIRFSEIVREDKFESLIRFIREHAISGDDDIDYIYKYPDSSDFVIVRFRPDCDKELSHLTLCDGIDNQWIDETGQASAQLRNSLINAASKGFNHDTGQKFVNIIAIELPQDFDDTDVTEAMYGTEIDYPQY